MISFFQMFAGTLILLITGMSFAVTMSSLMLSLLLIGFLVWFSESLPAPQREVKRMLAANSIKMGYENMDVTDRLCGFFADIPANAGWRDNHENHLDDSS
ncbi:hypothetical protein [Alkalicoccus chagannorensis]|uniref:hypothetical protein n=1 Tax=Alkalicoccus chagannorensis TaxID=427072 RepID=UPI00040210B1|nr:hypothetical protein [Alkalicoccus chagannorensis]